MALSQTQILDQEHIDICLLIAFSALFTYDVFLTFDQEVDRIWKRKFTGASVIFLLNRYSNIGIFVAAISANFGPQGRISCEVIDGFWFAFAALNAFSTSAFTTLRMWAILGQSLLVLIIFASATMPFPIFQLIEDSSLRFSSFSPLPLPYGGCQFINILPAKVQTSLETSNRVGFILSNAMALVGTIVKTRGIKRDACIAGIKPKLVDLLLRDGTMYFLTTLCLSALSVIFDYVTSPIINPASGFVANVLGSILISRFILNLRELDQVGQGPSLRSVSEVRFASSVIGNMGAPISYGIDDNTESQILHVSVDQATENPLAAGILFGSSIETTNQPATDAIPDEIEVTITELEGPRVDSQRGSSSNDV